MVHVVAHAGASKMIAVHDAGVVPYKVVIGDRRG